jgi:hypothetical protein
MAVSDQDIYDHYAEIFIEENGGLDAMRAEHAKQPGSQPFKEWVTERFTNWSWDNGYANDNGWTAEARDGVPVSEEAEEEELEPLPDDIDPATVTEEQVRDLADGYTSRQIKRAVRLFGPRAIQAKLKELGYDFTIEQIKEVGRTGKISDDIYEQAFPEKELEPLVEEEPVVEAAPEKTDMELMDEKFGNPDRPVSDLPAKKIGQNLGLLPEVIPEATDIDEQHEEPGVEGYPDTKTGLPGEDDEAIEDVDVYTYQNPESEPEPEGEPMEDAVQDAADLDPVPLVPVEEEDLDEQGSADTGPVGDDGITEILDENGYLIGQDVEFEPPQPKGKPSRDAQVDTILTELDYINYQIDQQPDEAKMKELLIRQHELDTLLQQAGGINGS